MAEAPELWISGHLAEKIRAHGAETYPHECCGALLGRDSNAVLASNRGEGSLTAAREKGLDVVGWYHSHPDHPAAPSEYDRDHAWPWYSYIIVSVANGKPEQMTSWRLNDDRAQFTSEDLQIRESAKA